MRTLILYLLLFYIGDCCAFAKEISPGELSLTEALRFAERQSPDIKASHNRESEADASLSVAQSYLYPSVELSAVESFGFAGSSSPTPAEFGGLLNSPYRSGPGVGVVGKMTLFDLGNWYGVSAAREGLRANEEQTKITRLNVLEGALSAYLEASRFRGNMEAWKHITTKIEAVEKTVKRLVKTGQYSDVSRLLIQDQADEARMNQLAFEERYRQSLKRLSLLLGLDEKSIACPIASELKEDGLAILNPSEKSPLLSHVEAEISAAQSQASQASSKHLPKLYAVGSAGYLDKARLVEKQNYSAWIGLSVPIFEGFRISSEAERAHALADEKENQLSATQLELNESNAHLDETINVARIELKLLEDQRETANRAFDLARRRYLSFLGPVIDLREALRSLARIESQMNNKNAELLLAIGSKKLLNGGTLNGASAR